MATKRLANNRTSSSASERWRLFAAVPVTEAVRALMRSIRQDLAAHDWTLRWVDPALAHLTVKFFGDTNPAIVESLERKLAFAASRAAPLTLRTTELILLGPRRRPNVLSLAMASAPDDPAAMEQLSRLAEDVERQTAGIGAGGNQRGFKAHLTLGRFKDQDGAPPEAIDVLHDMRPPACIFTVDRLQLVRSVLSQQGPAYTTLGEWRLGQVFVTRVADAPEVHEHG
jgi:2'-5' RNA ligase